MRRRFSNAGRKLAIAALAGGLIAGAVAAIVISPVLLRYRGIQDALGLVREFREIEFYGADLTGIFAASPLIALWHTPNGIRHPEGELFPGVVALKDAQWLVGPECQHRLVVKVDQQRYGHAKIEVAQALPDQ